MADIADQRERELKFDVPEHWELVEPAGVVPPGGSLRRDRFRLESTYHDTATFDLLAAGLTLRRRRGDDDEGWQLKVPDGDARTELRLPAEGRGIPAPLRELVTGVRAGAALVPVAILTTDRTVLRVVAPDGSELLEIVVDDVSATRPRSDTSRQWREVEIELHGGDEALLARAAAWLRGTGARPAKVGSKLARALGMPTAPKRKRTRLSGLIGHYLDEQYEAMLVGDLDLRRGRDAIHATRVATRRYRSVLRVFASVLDAERAGALDTELQWYAGVLGEVRDRQVLRRHLDSAVAGLPPELVLGPVSARIHNTLDAEEATARSALARTLRGRRYQALLRELRDWRADLPVTADRPAKAVTDFLARAERRVERRIAAAPAGTGRDEAMHRARKAAKRARYVAEVARPELGKHARSRAKAMKHVQTHLGDRQDAVVAAEFLRRVGAIAGSVPGENGFTFGLLYQREVDHARHEDRAVR